MISRDKLWQLAESVGLERGYHDIWGNWIESSDDTVNQILRSVGIVANSDQEIDNYQHTIQEQAHSAPNVLVLTHPVTSMHVKRRYSSAVVKLESGERIVPTVDGVELKFNAPLPLGYHLLETSAEDEEGTFRIIVVPERCYIPAEEGRFTGLACQLYSLQSGRPFGLGDFSDLRKLVHSLEGSSASFIGLNPLHALSIRDALGYSPYSPTSRVLLNIIYIDPTVVEEAEELELKATSVRDESGLIDYAEVMRAKLQVYERLYEVFVSRHGKCRTKRGKLFKQYVASRGKALHEWALYEALSEYFCQNEECPTYQSWPPEYRSPVGLAVRKFEKQNKARIDFYKYLQWQAEEQLSVAAQEAKKLGVGLYLDLAVGVSAGSSAVWADRQLYADGASAGAPPDLLNVQGQVWGLPPFRPDELKERAYEPFIEMLRFNMRYAGALRIDHIMSLMRLFWVPEGRRGDNGVYVRYNFEDLLGIVCLESERNKCVVVGEDLGTVPDEVRAGMDRRGILSYKVLYFMKDYNGDGSFISSDRYPREALVTASTHDLPTLCGFWQGTDLEVRRELSLYSATCTYESEIENRAKDKTLLTDLLRREYLFSPSDEPTPAEFAAAVHSFILRTNSTLRVLQVEDLLHLSEQANMPGTVTEHPNWRHRYRVGIQEIAELFKDSVPMSD